MPPANALVVVFDCDMEAHGDFLAHTLPYMATQPRTALVQTPQTFYNVVPSADIFNHHNLTFYQAMQPGLDAWGATVCCGTNFARVRARYEVGYFPIESITEDYLLSLKLATAGWTVRFHAATVCTGEAPEDLRQIFKQRNRWCCGCFQVFLHPSLPRWLIGLARRSPVKAVCWINAPLSYLGTLLTVPLWAVVPALSLYANVHPVKALTPSLVLLWLAYFYLLVLLTEMMPSRPPRPPPLPPFWPPSAMVSSGSALPRRSGRPSLDESSPHRQSSLRSRRSVDSLPMQSSRARWRPPL